MKTNHYKGLRGWTSETRLANGWEVVTMKRANGKVSAIPRKGEHGEDGSFSFVMGQDRSFVAAESTGKATEKEIKKVHEAGLRELWNRHPDAFRREIRVTFNDGDTIETWFNAPDEETVIKYYVGQPFEKSDETMHTAKRVEFLD